MKILKVVIVALLALNLSVLAYAAEAMEKTNITPGNTVSAGTPAAKAKRFDNRYEKGRRGATNLLFGWTEIPKTIVSTTQESKNPFWGITGGTLKGVAKAFPKTISGAADLVTLPFGQTPGKPAINPGDMTTGGK